MSYVTDVIGESYKQWDPYKLIIISAPTGSGKTTFVLNELLPYAAAQDMHICYFTNRTALKEQVQTILEKNHKSYSNYFHIFNYQKLFAMLRTFANNSTKYDTEISQIINCAYFVFDEAHYLVADAYFNHDLGNLIAVLHNLLYNAARNSIKILISASTDYLKLSAFMLAIHPGHYNNLIGSLLAELPYAMSLRSYITKILHTKFIPEINLSFNYELNEKRKYPSLFWSSHGTNIETYSLLIHNDPKNRLYHKPSFQDKFATTLQKAIHTTLSCHYCYSVEASNYRYLTPVYFNNYEEIAVAIKATPITEKWLVFVDSIDEAYDLLQRLNNQPFDSVVITADNKNRPRSLSKKQFQSITTDECFTSRILIATSVLDNGINLKDESIKHVVIPGCLKYEFIQMLGRKRRQNNNDCISLYIQHIPESKMLNKVNRDIVLKVQSLMRATKNQSYKHNYAREMRLLYDFYDLMAMFEKSQDNRFVVMMALIEYTKDKNEEKLKSELQQYRYLFPILKDYGILLQNCGATNELWLETTDKNLMDNDFMWLRQQLSWIGLEYTTSESPLNPHNPNHWITQLIKRVLIDFLDSNVGMLDEKKQTELKELFMVYIRSFRPRHKNHNSKGSIGIINKCFKEFDIPYHIIAKRASDEEAQKQRWFILAIPPTPS